MNRDPGPYLARDLMTSPVLTTPPDAPRPAVAALLVSHGIASAPVVDAAGRLLGLVDELGDLDRAIDLAAELSGSPRRPVFIRPHRGMRQRIFGTVADSLVESVAAEIESRLWLESLRS